MVVVRLIWLLMVVLPPPVRTEPAAGLVEVGAVGRVEWVMVAATPPVLALPATGPLVVRAVGRIRREMKAAAPPAAVRPAAVYRAMRTGLAAATARWRVWPLLSSRRQARFLPEVLATR